MQPFKSGMEVFILLLLPPLRRRVAEEDPAAERADGVGGAEAVDLIAATIAVRTIIDRPAEIESGQFQRRHEQQVAELFELAAPAAHVAAGFARVDRLLHLGVECVNLSRQRRPAFGGGDGVAEDDLLVDGQAQAADCTILAKAPPAPTMPARLREIE